MPAYNYEPRPSHPSQWWWRESLWRTIPCTLAVRVFYRSGICQIPLNAMLMNKSLNPWIPLLKFSLRCAKHFELNPKDTFHFSGAFKQSDFKMIYQKHKLLFSSWLIKSSCVFMIEMDCNDLQVWMCVIKDFYPVTRMIFSYWIFAQNICADCQLMLHLFPSIYGLRDVFRYISLALLVFSVNRTLLVNVDLNFQLCPICKYQSVSLKASY